MRQRKPFKTSNVWPLWVLIHRSSSAGPTRLSAQHAAQAELAAAAARNDVTEDDIRTLVERLGDVSAVLARAKPEDKAGLYRSLAVGLVYDPATRVAQADAGVRMPLAGGMDRPLGYVHNDSVRGGT